MTLLDAIHKFDGVPESRRPSGMPRLPGVEEDLFWPIVWTAAVRVLGRDRLERCETLQDLEAAVVAFRRAVHRGELSNDDWSREIQDVLNEYMSLCHAAATAAPLN